MLAAGIADRIAAKLDAALPVVGAAMVAATVRFVSVAVKLAASFAAGHAVGVTAGHAVEYHGKCHCNISGQNRGTCCSDATLPGHVFAVPWKNVDVRPACG